MRWTCALSLLLALACSPIGPSGGDDTGNSSGTDGSGVDHRITDAGRTDSRRPDAGGRDLTGVDWMSIDIAAFDIAGYDLGMREYDGGSEPGVVCGEATCTAGPCCIGWTGAACDGTNCLANVPCDGNEDCDAGICVASGGGMSYSISCVAPGAVDAGRAVCVNSSQCDAGGVCCSISFFTNVGLDLGWCETAHCGN